MGIVDTNAHIRHISHCDCHICIYRVVFPFVLKIDTIRANDRELGPESRIKATAVSSEEISISPLE